MDGFLLSVCSDLLWYASLAYEKQVFQVGMEQRTVNHGDAQSLLYDEAYGAVIREPDLG